MSEMTNEPQWFVKLGKRLLSVREQLSMTQVQFANLLGLSHRSYVAYELGYREPPLNLVIRLLEKTSVDSDWLLQGKGSEPRFKTAEDDDDAIWKAQEIIAEALHDTDSSLTSDQRRALFKETVKLLRQMPEGAEEPIKKILMLKLREGPR